MLPCGNQCCVYDKSYKKFFLPVVHNEVIAFLMSKRFADSMNIIHSMRDCDILIYLLFKSKDWMLRIFGKSSVKKYNVSGFFLQLIATNIIDFEWKGKNVLVILGRDNDGNLKYENKLNWEGLEFREKSRGSTMTFSNFIL